MSSGDDSAPENQFWQLVRGPLASWALFTVVDLGIADELAASGPTPSGSWLSSPFVAVGGHPSST